MRRDRQAAGLPGESRTVGQRQVVGGAPGAPAFGSRIQEAVRASYGLRAAVLDPHVARIFAETVDRQVASLLASTEAAHESLLTRSLRPRPPTSLRDVDASADFGAVGYAARRRFEFLGAAEYDDDESDYAVAEEEE